MCLLYCCLYYCTYCKLWWTQLLSDLTRHSEYLLLIKLHFESVGTAEHLWSSHFCPVPLVLWSVENLFISFVLFLHDLYFCMGIFSVAGETAFNQVYYTEFLLLPHAAPVSQHNPKQKSLFIIMLEFVKLIF